MNQPTILVTGATGFVGRHLCAMLTQSGFPVRQAVRKPSLEGDVAVVGDLGPQTDWASALDGIEVVIHLAARVHVLNEQAADPLREFRLVNRDGTIRLAQACVSAGVRRLVYISSIKVMGEGTAPGKPYHESMRPDPQDPYGVSKWEAEEYLREQKVLETVIVRPPLIYGPHVGANFLRLIKLVDRGLPLPLGSTGNKRSLVAVGNLCHFLMCCILHPAAVGETFLVSDGEDLSTTELVRQIGNHLGKRPLLLPAPYSVVRIPAALLRREEVIHRLWGWLQVDSQKARSLLGWQPPIEVGEGIRQTIKWYRDTYVA
jgi:nucleoside-diphosphate-sugar epimerase